MVVLPALALFWAALYALRAHRRRRAPASFLPAPSTSAPSDSPVLFSSRGTRITLHNFHISAQLFSFNDIHLSASARLRKSRWKSLLTLAYDAGCLLGVLGMVGSLLLLVWASFQLALSLYDQSHPIPPPHTSALHKRDTLLEAAPLVSTNPHHSPLTLIIPGITTPLSDLPLLLVALLTTQVIHELGHAVAAALESVSLSSVGFGLTVLLPSAFVAFPAGAVDSLPPRPRLRIITAGAFHNLLLWLALVALGWTRLSATLWSLLGYGDVSRYGRVVAAVDEASPLYGYLPIGAVIYKVGDDTLDTGSSAAERWEALLTHRPILSDTLGWCAEEPWFAAHNSSCCTSTPGIPSQACFAPSSDPSFERCVDPLLFLDSDTPSPRPRCVDAVDCGHGQLCVRPRGDQELLALTLHILPWLQDDEDDSEQTVVWQGDRTEILRDVAVGDWLPRFRALPIGLPVLFSQFFAYVKMLTLSLYFFNLLPLPFLDGGQLLDALWDWYCRNPVPYGDDLDLDGGGGGGESTSDSLAELEGGANAARRSHVPARNAGSATNLKAGWGWGWRRTAHVGAGALLGTCVVLSLANAYLAR